MHSNESKVFFLVENLILSQVEDSWSRLRGICTSEPPDPTTAEPPTRA